MPKKPQPITKTHIQSDALSQALLKQRTNEYAQKEETVEVKEELKQFLGFRLGSEWYLINMSCIEEIVKPTRISPLPRQKDFVLGVMNIRGDIILNIDLGQLLTQTATSFHEQSRIIIIRSEAERTGFLADEVIGVQRLDTGDFQMGMATIQGEAGEFTLGLYNRDDKHFVWLNMERVLSEVWNRLSQ